MLTPGHALRTLRADEPRPTASGAFIQISATSAAAGQAWWRGQLAAMRSAGMDVAVVQFVASDDNYYYPSSVAGSVSNSQDAVQHILDEAQEAQIKVFLGLQLDHSFWSRPFDKPARLARNLATLEELRRRYGGHTALAGWYIPEELDDLTAHRPNVRDVLDYFGEIAQAARRDSKLPVMISPYFSRDVDAVAYARWWDETALPAVRVDILAMQDGVGTHRNTVDQAREVFQALAPVAKKHGVKFWANNESFDQTHGWPVDEEPWAAVPVAFEEFLKQMQATSPFVEKTITFEFTHYMDPVGSPGAARLYRDYFDYYKKSRQAAAPKPRAATPSETSPP